MELSRMVKLLEYIGKYYDMSMSVRPTVYTNDVLRSCYDTLIKEDPAYSLIAVPLFGHLKIQAIIDAEDSSEWYFKSFKEFPATNKKGSIHRAAII